MEVAKDIVRISVPFAAGVLLSAFLSKAFIIAAITLPLVAGLMFACAGSRRVLPFMLLFFALGAFCHSSSELMGRKPARLFPAALSSLTSRIDALPFRHEGTGALTRALLTGQRELLEKETVDAFRKAGAAHILALSGMHLGIIYLIINGLLSILGRSPLAARIRSAAGVLLAAFYTLMTAASPSTVRALLFIILGELALHCPGRKKTPAGVWCTALFVQLVLRPSVIRSPGFQLSYLAMLGIFTIFPVLNGWYPSAGRRAERFNPLRRIWSAVALSCSCQAFTAPLVWICFHSFPKHFILTNLLALPLTEALMVCALASLLLAALPFTAESTALTLAAKATDYLAGALQRSLEVIAGM